MARACQDCRFAEPVDNRVVPQVECRRHAPIMVLKRSSCSTFWAPGWPSVGVKEWCGEYAPAPAENGANSPSEARAGNPVADDQTSLTNKRKK